MPNLILSTLVWRLFSYYWWNYLPLSLRLALAMLVENKPHQDPTKLLSFHFLLYVCFNLSCTSHHANVDERCWVQLDKLFLQNFRSSTTTGLGGTLFPPAGSGSAVSNVENKNDGKALKETAVPAELFQVIFSFLFLKSYESLDLFMKDWMRFASRQEGLSKMVNKTLISSKCYFVHEPATNQLFLTINS